MEEPARRDTLPLGLLVGAAMALGGFMLGTRALGDNSFLTHLATGRLILDSGSVPTADPYTFTAHGAPWVVQSWLASVLYATAEELAGPGGIRVLVGCAYAGAVAVAWGLCREVTSVIVRAGIVGLVMLIGAGLWSERPLVFGLLLLGTALLVTERRWPWWLLVPLGWVWANIHGSFPLGIVALVLLVVGTALDRQPVRADLRYAAALAGGAILGAIGPLGIDALTFPVDLLSNQEMLKNVVEWRSPDFESTAQRAFLVQVALAVWTLARRPSWRYGLVLAGFGVLALTSARNIAPASIALLPGIAHGAPSLGSLRSTQPIRRGALVLVALVVALPLVINQRLGQPDYELRDTFPVASFEWLTDRGIDPTEVRTAYPDIVGNFVEVLYAPEEAVFYDDRFDMFPDDVSEDHLDLIRGRAGWKSAIDRYDIDLAITSDVGAWGQLLTADPDWRTLYLEDAWIVACRRGADLGPETC